METVKNVLYKTGQVIKVLFINSLPTIKGWLDSFLIGLKENMTIAFNQIFGK